MPVSQSSLSPSGAILLVLLCVGDAQAQPKMDPTCTMKIALSTEKPPCKDGFECIDAIENGTLVICAPTENCTKTRFEPGKYCNRQGTFEPELCDLGFFCKDGDKEKCPSNHFCLWGTADPESCEPMTLCPEGSSRRYPLGPLIWALILDGFAVAGIVVYRHLSARDLERRKRRREELFQVSLRGSQSVKSVGLAPAESPVDEPVAPKRGTEAAAEALLLKDQEVSSEKVARELAPEYASDDDTPDVVVQVAGEPPPLMKAKQTIAECACERLQKSFERATKHASIRIDFDGLTLKLKPPIDKVILDNVSGTIEPGRVLAIMGPSGAGKTTFMNVLMNKVARTGGVVKLNGHKGEISAYKKAVGFVPQEDIMLRELSVRQNIAYSARCRLPSTWSDEEVSGHVHDILEVLGLDHVSESPIGDETKRGVSGGQRKRVNIGIELAACPIVLFLDEPTSGLDATSALEVCSVLKQIANLGLIVVAVIHQPRQEIVEQLDDVLLLRPGGKTVYLGPTDELIGYFEDLGFEIDRNQNPADVFMDIASGKGTKVGSDKRVPAEELPIWDHTKDKKEAEVCGGNGPIDVSHYGAPFLLQFFLAHNRFLKQQQAHFAPVIIENFVAAFAGTVNGLALLGFKGVLYTGIVLHYPALSSAPQLLPVPITAFLLGIIVSVASAPPGVSIFGDEIIVYWREAASGHSRLAYYLGKTIATTYRMLVMALHFIAPCMLIGSPRTKVGDFYMIVLSEVFGVYGISTIVSAVVIRGNKSLIALIVCLITASGCGFAPTIKDWKNWGLEWMVSMSPFRWAAEGLFHTEVWPSKHVFDVYHSADYFGYKLDRFGMDIGIAFALGFAFRVIGFLLLIGLNRQKQK